MKFSKFTEPYLLETDLTSQEGPTSVNHIKSNPSPTGGVSTKASTPSSSSSVSNIKTNKSPSGSVSNQAPTPSRLGNSSNSSSFSSTMKEEMNFMRNIGLMDKRKVDPKVFSKVMEQMDMEDYRTARLVYSLNEAQENALLLDLTNKLYKMIIDKVDDVEFGEIPNSRGDITRLKSYQQILDCIDVLRGIFKQYREDLEPVDVLGNAVSNLENHRDLFRQCFAAKIDLGIIMYNSMTLAVINGLSYMIAVCIEYIKDPKKSGMKIALNKAGVIKVKECLVYENLIKFNDSCLKGDVRNVLTPMIRMRAKNFIGGLALGFKAALVFGGVLLAIIPMIKDLVYFFFALRSRISTYLNVQADLLEMNAKELESSDIQTVDDKDKVIKRQLSIAKLFHQTADKIAVDVKQSETEANRELKQDSKRYRIDEVDPNPEPSDQEDDSLF